MLPCPLPLRLRRQRAPSLTGARSPPLRGRRGASLTAPRSPPLRGRRGASLTAPLPLAQGKKILQDAQAPVLTFLGVKLRGIEVVAPQHRGKLHTVIRRGDYGISILGRGIVRMHEIGKGDIGDTCEEGTRALLLQLVPAHVRHFQAGCRGRQGRRETSYLPGKYAETRGQPKLLTLRQ